MHRQIPVSLTAILASLSIHAQEPETETVPRSQWAAQTQFGAGYDTNANGSTGEQTFLGFTLNPHNVATESLFADAGLSVQHTATLAPQRGFISTMELNHRFNPDASFVDQTVAALGTEAVLIRGDARFSAGVSGYASWLKGEDQDDENGANLDLTVSHTPGTLEAAFTVRVSRLTNEHVDYEILDVDRYLAGLSFTQHEIGTHGASIGVTLLGGRDVARRVGSPFGNNRIGGQLSANWALRPQVNAYLELSSMVSDYEDDFFDVDRKDEQYDAAAALEFTDWPAPKWTFAPQVRWVRNGSNVSLFEYDRVEAVLYVRRAL